METVSRCSMMEALYFNNAREKSCLIFALDKYLLQGEDMVSVSKYDFNWLKHFGKQGERSGSNH